MQLTRLELYERVCGTPLSKLAPEFGLSGTALAAVCRQYQIPYPGSGYWTRKSLGLPADFPALPEGTDETIEITPSIPKPRQKKAPEDSPTRKTRTVAKARRLEHHPLLFGVEEHLRNTRTVKDGEFLRPYKRILPDLISSEPALLRALSIANDLYLALDKQGYRIHIAPPDDDLRRIFDWCWDNEIPLRFWGRFDAEVPISIPILSKFLARKSGRYTCKLVRHFHPKVIWWRGFGAYIGSANLTSKAWYNNVEAGVFLTEEELVRGGHDLEILDMFAEIEKHAAPLTQELFDLLSARNKALTQQDFQDKPARERVNDTVYVPHWDGLARATEKSAKNLRRQAFLNEWSSTLQIIRDVSFKISRDGNRPSWLSKDAPTGAQADQFLHAHYYNTVMQGGRADYEGHYGQNRSNPDKAISDAIDKWRRLPSTSDENTMLNVTAPQLRDAFSETKLRKLTEAEFVSAISKVHAAREYARRAANDVVGLKPGRPYSREEKVVALARHMFRGFSHAAPDPRETLYHVLYGGVREEVPQRLWDTLHDKKTKVELLGISTLGEIIGWAMPDLYPPRNGRTSKALRSLGYDVRVHVG